MRYFTIIFLTFLTLACYAEDAKPLPKEAQKIIADYNSNMDKIKKDTIVKLQKALTDTTKKGDLDTAIRIKEAIESLNNASTVASTPNDPKVIKWKVKYDNSHTRTMEWTMVDETTCSVKITESTEPIAGMTFNVKYDPASKLWIANNLPGGNSETFQISKNKDMIKCAAYYHIVELTPELLKNARPINTANGVIVK